VELSREISVVCEMVFSKGSSLDDWKCEVKAICNSNGAQLVPSAENSGLKSIQLFIYLQPVTAHVWHSLRGIPPYSVRALVCDVLDWREG